MRLSKELVKLLLSVDYAQFVLNYNQILGLSSSSCIHMRESAALLAIIDDEQAWDLLFTFSDNNPKCSVIEFLLADLSEENHVNDLISDCDASQLESVVVSFQSLVNAHSRIGYLNSNDNQERMAVLSKRLEGLKAELEELKKKERKREFRQKLTALIGKLKSSTGPSHSDSVLFSDSNSDVSSSQGSSASNVGTSVNESSATSSSSDLDFPLSLNDTVTSASNVGTSEDESRDVSEFSSSMIGTSQSEFQSPVSTIDVGHDGSVDRSDSVEVIKESSSVASQLHQDDPSCDFHGDASQDTTGNGDSSGVAVFKRQSSRSRTSNVRLSGYNTQWAGVVSIKEQESSANGVFNSKKPVQNHLVSIGDDMDIDIVARTQEKKLLWKRIFGRFQSSQKHDFKGVIGFVNLEIADLNLPINDQTQDTVLGRLFCLYQKEEDQDKRTIMRGKLCKIFEKCALLRGDTFIQTALYLQKNSASGNIEKKSLFQSLVINGLYADMHHCFPKAVPLVNLSDSLMGADGNTTSIQFLIEQFLYGNEDKEKLYLSQLFYVLDMHVDRCAKGRMSKRDNPMGLFLDALYREYVFLFNKKDRSGMAEKASKQAGVLECYVNKIKNLLSYHHLPDLEFQDAFGMPCSHAPFELRDRLCNGVAIDSFEKLYSQMASSRKNVRSQEDAFDISGGVGGTSSSSSSSEMNEDSLGSVGSSGSNSLAAAVVGSLGLFRSDVEGSSVPSFSSSSTSSRDYPVLAAGFLGHSADGEVRSMGKKRGLESDTAAVSALSKLARIAIDEASKNAPEEKGGHSL